MFSGHLINQQCDFYVFIYFLKFLFVQVNTMLNVGPELMTLRSSHGLP